MPISFTCPHCGLQTEVAEVHAGQTGPCAGCGRSITVPPLAGTPGYSTGGKNSGAIIVVVVLAVLGLLALFLCGGFLFLSVGRAPRMTPLVTLAETQMCSGNLRRIGMAMQMYHEVHGSFPPAYVADENGEPMHSWRVLLLPYLGEQDLYDQYNFDESWDSADNLALLEMRPDVYYCPQDWANEGSETSFAMIVGPGTVSDGPGTTMHEDVQDGLHDTILLVEVSGSGVKWTEPVDLNAAEIDFSINDGSGEGIRSDHVIGVNVLFCDGSVRMLGSENDPQQIKAMTTIAGGEGVDGVVEY